MAGPLSSWVDFDAFLAASPIAYSPAIVPSAVFFGFFQVSHLPLLSMSILYNQYIVNHQTE